MGLSGSSSGDPIRKVPAGMRRSHSSSVRHRSQERSGGVSVKRHGYFSATGPPDKSITR